VTPVLVTILAWIGALLSCLLTIPQALRTLRSNQLEGLSATTYWLILGNATVWAAWSALSGEYAAGVPALVNGPAAALILRRLYHSQRSVEPNYVADPPGVPQTATDPVARLKKPSALTPGPAAALFAASTSAEPACSDDAQATNATRPRRPVSRIAGRATSADTGKHHLALPASPPDAGGTPRCRNPAGDYSRPEEVEAGPQRVVRTLGRRRQVDAGVADRRPDTVLEDPSTLVSAASALCTRFTNAHPAQAAHLTERQQASWQTFPFRVQPASRAR
jgi:uncharacterized protein with PQ loop repeat